MNFKEKVENAFLSKAAEGVAVAIGVLVIWGGTKLAPIVVSALEEKLPKETLVSLLLASLGLNFITVILFWILNKKPLAEFRLKYGIYWDKDKNPHCPNCKIPIGAYSEYTAGWLRDPHKLLPHIIHTLSDRPVSSTTELSTAKFALALADNIAYLY